MADICGDSVLTGQDGSIEFKPPGTSFCLDEFGSFVIEYYGPKGRGPARSQEVMELLFCEMLALKGVTDINGPDFTPHQTCLLYTSPSPRD